MEYPGFMQAAIFQFALRLEGKHAKGIAREQMRARMRAAVLYNKASQVDNLVGNNDPACLWD
jgi:hypothetical protein